MDDKEVVEVLVVLGLTLLEARIYLSLIQKGCTPTSVREISRNAEVVRQDTYRVLSDLLKRGIVEKVLSHPIMYKCIPVDRGITKLLSERNDEYLNVKKKSDFLLQNYQNIRMKNDSEENLTFSFTANLDILLQKMKKESLETKKGIEMIYSLERMSLLSFHMLEDIKQALDRGVVVKIIMTAAAGAEFSKSLRELRKTDVEYENLQIKYLKKRSQVGLTIFDGVRCYIRITERFADSLFTTNENVVALASYYFNDAWENALIKPESSI